MVQYFAFEGIKKLDSFADHCWINISSPTDDDFRYLQTTLNIPNDVIHDVLDIDERSRIEIVDDLMIIILRIPIVRLSHETPISTIPLGVFIGSNFTITLCLTESDIINEIISQQKTINTSTPAVGFTVSILQRSTNLYLKYLKQINFQTTKIQKELEKSSKNSELLELLKLEKSLVYFVTSLKSNEILLLKLRSLRFNNFNNIDDDTYDDLVVDTKQAIEMSKIYSDILSGMMDAFASIISNNLNVTMKQLTSITILLMLPTLIASLFGMNVPNMLGDNNLAFALIFLVSLLVSATTLVIFKKRNLF